MKTKHQHRLKSAAGLKPNEKFTLAFLIGAVAGMGLLLLNQIF